MKKRTRGLYWIVAGFILLAAALLLALYNWHQDQVGGQETQRCLSALQQQMPHIKEADLAEEILPETDLLAEYAEELEETPTEAIIDIDGEIFLGVLSIPALNLELPVLRDWSYPNLKIAPCRYVGTIADGNLVLAAHNYRSHFGRIGELNTGDTIFFTDCSGIVHAYEVVQTELVAGSDMMAMETGTEDWDLTLFTCTWSGRNRITVRALQSKSKNTE